MSDTATTENPREKLTKKAITADHPTWCPGCGDFAVLASFYKVIEKRQLDHETSATFAGMGSASRFPYSLNAHAAPLIPGPPFRLAAGFGFASPACDSLCFRGRAVGFALAA